MITVEQKTDNLVLAHIRRGRDGWQADWFFRKMGDKWVISEPIVGESGAVQHLTSGNYAFITYPITDDLNKKVVVKVETMGSDTEGFFNANGANWANFANLFSLFASFALFAKFAFGFFTLI